MVRRLLTEPSWDLWCFRLPDSIMRLRAEPDAADVQSGDGVLGNLPLRASHALRARDSKQK